MAKNLSVEELSIFCKKKGFVFRSADIYGGLAGFFDYAPLGFELKKNIIDDFYKEFITKRDDVLAQDSSIITNPAVWKASGHTENFADLVLTTKKTKTKIRADHFIEEQLKISADGMSAKGIQELITKHKLTHNKEEFEEINNFNLMFETQVGADADKKATAYLRPETCQSIFLNFKLIAEICRMKLPFGVAQVGKAFRNEISPRDFLFRSREFEQAEIEYFYNPKKKCELLTKELAKTKFQFLSAQTQDAKKTTMQEITIEQLIKEKKVNDTHGYWLAIFFQYFQKLGLSYENLRVREHVKTELSHYSNATVDIDYKFPFGFKEMFGLANRANFDLQQHQEHSKVNLELFDEETQTKILPEVIEPSLGIGRLFLAIIQEAYVDDAKRGNVVLKLAPKLAPYKVAVLPLVKKGGLQEKAREIYDVLVEEDVRAYFDVAGSIGKRYAREDEKGTAYCITVDFETLEEGKLKNTVTLRDRDSTEQKRLPLATLSHTLRDLINQKKAFGDIKE